jgi:nucleotide-binding universal stress UspA family protein
MYKKILAAVNEFTNSEIAARYAIALAKSCGSSLSLVFVADKKISKELFRHAEAALERLFFEARSLNLEVESITEKGDPLKKIIDLARKNGVDIVFAATRREDVERRYFLKTLARELVMKLPCATAIVRVVRMDKSYPGNILVPLREHMTDIEDRSCFVANLAMAFHASVTLFHLTSPITDFFHGETLLNPAQREKRLPDDIDQFTDCLKKYDIRHEKKTGQGSVSRSITIEAAHRRNDLIVMGASERSLLRSVTGGNPVEEVLRETPCNLIIFRPG